MKSRARSCVWWPGLDRAIEELVKGCNRCQSTAVETMNTKPTLSWPWPTRAWSRIHIDFAGPLEKHMVLVIVDAYSKWIEAIPMSSSTSCSTIEHLQTLFAKFGIPDTVVTDNGTAFVSQEFEQFLVQNGINHITSSPYHPATNGQAERAVQIVKQGLRKVTSGNLSNRLAKILFNYRLTPHSTTGETPSQLLLGRDIKSTLDLVKPNRVNEIVKQQSKQFYKEERRSGSRKFDTGDKVYVRNFRPGLPWIGGEISVVNGPANYTVELLNGFLVRWHVDHIKSRVCPLPAGVAADEPETFSEAVSLNPSSSVSRPAPNPPPRRRVDTRIVQPTRSSSRIRFPPDRYAPTISH